MDNSKNKPVTSKSFGMLDLQRTSSVPAENQFENVQNQKNQKSKLMEKYLKNKDQISSFVPQKSNSGSAANSESNFQSGPINTELTSDQSLKKKRSLKLTSVAFKSEEIQKQEEKIGDWATLSLKATKKPSKGPEPASKNPDPPINSKDKLKNKYKTTKPSSDPQINPPDESKEKSKPSKKPEIKPIKELKSEHEEDLKAQALAKEKAESERILREQREKEEVERKAKEEQEARAKEEEEAQKKAEENSVNNPIRIKRRILMELVNRLKKEPPTKSEFPEEIVRIQERPSMIIKMTKPRGNNDRQGGGGNQGNFQRDRNQKRKPMKDQRHHTQRDEQGDTMGRKPVDPFREKIKAMGNKWIQANKDLAENDKDLKLFKEVRFALNRLTPDNFDSLKKEIIGFAKLGPEACEKVALLIIEKSYSERRYSRVYAELCKYLKKDPSINYDEDEEGAGEENKKKKNFFITHLLNLIQATFDNHMSEERNTNVAALNENEKEEFFRLKKNRILGNVHFIGDLLTMKVISRRVIWICAYQMMVRFYNEVYDWVYNSAPGSAQFEENLEGILTLVEKVGPIVDADNKEDYTKEEELASANNFANVLERIGKKEIDKSELLNEHEDDPIINMNIIFDWMDIIKDHPIISTRIKCLIVNITDMRRTGWQKTILHQTGPKKRNELEKETREEIFKTPQGNDDDEDDWSNGKRGKGKKKGSDKFEYVAKETPRSAYRAKSKELNEEEVGKKLGNVYKRIEGGKMEDGTDTSNEKIESNLMDLLKETSSFTLVVAALNSIYEQKPRVYTPFIEILCQMISQKKLKPDDCAKAINTYLEKAAYHSSENPNLIKYFSSITATLLNEALSPLSALNYEARETIEKIDQDMVEDFELFLSEYFAELVKRVKEEIRNDVISHCRENCSEFEA